MQYISHTDFKLKNTAVTLGKFDGIHIGHRRLLNCVKQYKEQGLETVVFSFLLPPAALLSDIELNLIFTEEEKKEQLEKFGIDTVISYPFTKDTLKMEPEEFVEELLIKQLDAKVIIVGSDFRFGHNRRGDIELLKGLGEKYDYQVEVFEKVKIEGSCVSSSRIRKEIRNGNMELVNKMLGQPYFVSGLVTHGRKLGRTLGMPTANVVPADEKLIPPFGVYVSKTEVDGVLYEGITNIGVKPTVGEEKKRLVETFLFDYQGDLYGKQLKTSLHYFERPEKKFDSIEELKTQMEKDTLFGKQYFSKKTNINC